MKWYRKGDPPDALGIRRVQVYLFLELALFAPLLNCAAAMARGLGEF